MSIFSEDQLKRVFSFHLQRSMAENGYSEADVSRLTNISQSAINRLKNGQVSPTLYQTKCIAEIFNKKIDDFMLDKGIDDPKTKAIYVPILSTLQLQDPRHLEIYGFIERAATWAEHCIGLKIDSTFQSKILHRDCIVIIIPNHAHQDGDMVIFYDTKYYRLGTVCGKAIHALEAAEPIPIEMQVIIGTVLCVENKYIKDDHAVSLILETFNKTLLEKTLQDMRNSDQKR